MYWTRNLNIHEAIPGHLCPAAMLRLHYGMVTMTRWRGRRVQGPS